MTTLVDAHASAAAGAGHRVRRSRRLGTGMIVGVVVLVVLAALAVFAPIVSRQDPLAQDVSQRLQKPGSEHWLGTDRLGRDVFTRLVYGSRVSLLTGTLVVVAAVSIGLVLGLLSGYYGGRVDFVIQRGVDVVMAFPGILLAIGIMAFVGQGMSNLVVAIAIVNIPRVTRVARGSVLQVRTLDFVEAARAMGAADAYLLARHVLPSILAPIIVQATFTLVYAIRTESTLNFIGLGVPPPAPSWGGLLDDGKAYIQTAPWMIGGPAVSIAMTILALSLIGDGLRDYFDPRQDARATAA